MSLRRRTSRACRTTSLALCVAAALHGCSGGTRSQDAGADGGSTTSARDAAGDARAEDASAPSDAASDASVDAADAAEVSRPFDGHKKVLHVGDSTVGYAAGISLEFKRMFPAEGIAYVSHTMTSAGLHAVAEDRIVEKLVKRHSPDLVIIQLGTNNLTVPHPEVYVPDIKSILAQVGKRACYWIGPISLKFPERGMRGILRDNVAPCVFYDSYDLTLERQSDGLHPSQKAAIFWSKAFFEFAARNPATIPPL